MSQVGRLPPLTWLFVPADRPDRVEKAIDSHAHAVIVDLEDGVAPGAKDEARRDLPRVLAGPFGKPVYVRVNRLGTSAAEADLETVAGLDAVTGVHLPKVQGPAEVSAAAESLTAPRAAALEIHCMVESALGLERAFAIAEEPCVSGLVLGEADLRSETGVLEEGLDWARSRIVNAACAAGLPRPPQSVYTHVRDLDGLARSCARGRALGHFGRTVIHPSQLPAVEHAYLPSERDVLDAREMLEQWQAASVGAFALGGGVFVDAAVIRSAEATVRVAERYGTSG